MGRCVIFLICLFVLTPMSCFGHYKYECYISGTTQTTPCEDLKEWYEDIIDPLGLAGISEGGFELERGWGLCPDGIVNDLAAAAYETATAKAKKNCEKSMYEGEPVGIWTEIYIQSFSGCVEQWIYAEGYELLEEGVSPAPWKTTWLATADVQVKGVCL